MRRPASRATSAGLARSPVRGRRKTLEKIENLVSRTSAEDEVFYQDEADVHLNPEIGSTYLKPGQQPVVLPPGKNVKRYIFGALKETLNKMKTKIEAANEKWETENDGQMLKRFEDVSNPKV